MQPDTVISFLVDDAPLFQSQAWLLLHNLACLPLAQNTAILLSHCGPLSPELRRKAAALGARVQSADRFGTGPAAYCNKLRQCAPVLESGARDLILCDTDIGFLIDPARLVRPGMVRAKPVDLANPPADLLRTLLDRAGFTGAALDTRPDFAPPGPGARTHAFNCNGGLYALPSDLLRALAPVWEKWARFCLDQDGLLGRYTVHADQLGFALAMQELSLPFDPLPAEDNFPLHFAPAAYDRHTGCAPRVLHYHRRMRPDGRLRAPGVAAIDAQATAFDALVAGARDDPDFRALLARSHAQEALP